MPIIDYTTSDGKRIRLDTDSLNDNQKKDLLQLIEKDKEKKKVDEPKEDVKNKTSLKEDEGSPNLATAVGAGLISGAIKIPEGFVSLGADLIDLGFNTNIASEVESFFDKINPFEEIAEKRVAGKIVQTLTSFGVPTTIGFNIGRKLANKAVRAARAGKVKSFKDIGSQTKSSLSKLDAKKAKNALVKKQIRAEKFARGIGGFAGAGVGEAIVTDEDVGTLGDAFDTITSLDRTENLLGREDAVRRLNNRLKGGFEGAVTGALIGNALTAVGKVSKKGFNALFDSDPVVRKIDSVLSYLRPRRNLSQEVFERLNLAEGRKNSYRTFALQNMDIIENEVYQIAKNVSRKAGSKKEVNKIATAIDDYIKGGSPDSLIKQLKDLGATNIKDTTIANLKTVRDNIDEMSSSLREYLEGAKVGADKKKLKEIEDLSKVIGENTGKYITRTYEVLEKKRRPLSRYLGENPFTKFKPLAEEREKAFDYLKGQYAKQFLQKDLKTLKQLTPLFKGKKLTSDQLTNEVIKRPDLLKKIMTPDDIFQIEKQADEAVEKLIKGELDSVVKAVPGLKLDLGTGVDQGILKARKVPEQLRGVLGEIRDPRFNVGMTMGRIGKLLEEAKAYDEIAEMGDGKWLFDKGSLDQAAKTFKVPKDQLVELKFVDGTLPNAMQGKYTLKSIADEFMDNSKSNKIIDLYKYAFILPKSISQKMKTVYSPFTHVRNFISGATFTTMNGNGLYSFNPIKFFQGAKLPFTVGQQKGLRNFATEENFKQYRRLQELGVINTSTTFKEADDLFKDAAKITDFGDMAVDQIFNRAINPFRGINKLKQGARDFYMAEDDVWKVMSFGAERSKYSNILSKEMVEKALESPATMKRLLGRNVDEVNDIIRKADNSIDLDATYENILDITAANIVKNTVPNYNFVPKLVKKLAYAPMGNFVSFPAEMIRTTANVLSKGVDEIRLGKELGSKALQARGLGRLAGAIATSTIVPAAAIEAAKGFYGMTDEKMAALREFLPWFQENNQIMPFGVTEDGKGYKFKDLSYILPYDVVVKPAVAVMAAVGKGDETDEEIKSKIIDGAVGGFATLMSPFTDEAILTEALLDTTVRKGRKARGGNVYDNTDSFNTKLENSFDHIFKAFMPGSIEQMKRLVFAKDGLGIDVFETEGQPDKYNRTFDFGNELGGVFGFRTQEADPATSAKYKVTEFNKNLSTIEGNFISTALKETGALGYGVPTVEDIVGNYLREETQRFKEFKDMYRFIQATDTLGVNRKGVMQEVDRIREKSVKNALMAGKFDPITLGKGQEELFFKKAFETERSDVSAEFFRVYRNALQIINQLASRNAGISLDDQLDFGIYQRLLDIPETPNVEAEPQPVTPTQSTPDTGLGSVVTGQGPTVQGQGSTNANVDVRFRQGTITDPTNRAIAGLD